MSSALDFSALKAALDIRANGRVVAAVAAGMATGAPLLDAALGGGFARGTIATLEGAASCGRSALAAAILAGATAHGWAAWLDDRELYPPSLERAGVRLDRLILVAAEEPVAVARSADAMLRTRGFQVVVMPMLALRAPVWSRLGALAHNAGALLLVLGGTPGAALASFAATRVRCTIERIAWDGPPGLCATLAGYEMCAHVVKARRSRAGCCVRMTVGATPEAARYRELVPHLGDRRIAR